MRPRLVSDGRPPGSGGARARRTRAPRCRRGRTWCSSPSTPPAPTTSAPGVGRYAQTPNLDALGRRGTRFARCDTVAPITLPSHASHPHRALPAAPRRARQRHVRAGADASRRSPRRCARRATTPRRSSPRSCWRAATASTRASAPTTTTSAPATRAGTEVSERRAGPATDAALAALARLRAPWFLWVHYFDPHEEYRPPSAFADAASGPAPPLRRRDRLHRPRARPAAARRCPPTASSPSSATTARCSATRASSRTGCCSDPARGACRCSSPGPACRRARTEQCLVRTVDVAPTLLQLAGLPRRRGIDGVSLLPLPSSGWWRLQATQLQPRASCPSSPTSGTRCAPSPTAPSSTCRRRSRASSTSPPIPRRRATWRASTRGRWIRWRRRLEELLAGDGRVAHAQGDGGERAHRRAARAAREPRLRLRRRRRPGERASCPTRGR